MNLTKLIIEWVSNHSASDYLYELNEVLHYCPDLEIAHGEALRRVEFREKVTPGPVQRKVAEFKEGTWHYSIGDGGTRISLSPNSADISSYYMNPHGDMEIKGTASISFTQAKEAGELSKAEIEWILWDDLEHSWGRLNSIWNYFRIHHHTVELTTEVPDVIKNFNWWERECGGW